MISLLLTLFISLFCCCSSYYQLEDHKENTCIVDLVEPQNKNIGYVGVEGIQVYFTNVDLLNGDFYYYLLENLPSYTNLSLHNTTNGDYYFYNLGGAFYGVTSAHVSETKLYDIQTIRITKTRTDSYSYENVPYIAPYYNIDFINNQDLILRINLIYAVPFLDEDALNTGVSCVYLKFNNYHLPTDFVYTEDTNHGDTLFYQFGYINYYMDKDSYNEGYQQGFNVGENEGYTNGYQNGYSTGYSEGSSIDDTASTIFTGILDVALVPVNVFLSIFNFEVFGINIGGIVSGLLTLSVVIIILRFLFGGRKDD